MNSRKNDPKSSKIAYARHEASLRASSNRRKVLELVKKFPDLTSSELAEKAKEEKLMIDRPEIARRLPDLYRKNLVFRPNEGSKEELKWRAIA
jgi:predicted HTH transcriptional regulator